MSDGELPEVDGSQGSTWRFLVQHMEIDAVGSGEPASSASGGVPSSEPLSGEDVS